MIFGEELSLSLFLAVWGERGGALSRRGWGLTRVVVNFSVFFFSGWPVKLKLACKLLLFGGFSFGGCPIASVVEIKEKIFLTFFFFCFISFFIFRGFFFRGEDFSSNYQFWISSRSAWNSFHVFQLPASPPPPTPLPAKKKMNLHRFDKHKKKKLAPSHPAGIEPLKSQFLLLDVFQFTKPQTKQTSPRHHHDLPFLGFFSLAVLSSCPLLSFFVYPGVMKVPFLFFCFLIGAAVAFPSIFSSVGNHHPISFRHEDSFDEVRRVEREIFVFLFAHFLTDVLCFFPFIFIILFLFLGD